MYNAYNLEADTSLSKFENFIKTFRSFLDSENISKGSIRSYTSDVRHFLGWFYFFLKSNRLKIDILVLDISPLLKLVNQKVLEAYKDYQTSNNTPLKTINRRFSSLRRFGSFCQSQRWITSNVFDTLRNISLNRPFPEDKHHLSEFRVELWQKGASKSTIKNYLNDVKQFLAWSKNNYKL